MIWACPGFGKTIVTLEALRILGCKNVLIVAPVSLLSVWEQERKKFYDLPTVMIRGTPQARARLWGCKGVKVVGYETLRVDFDFAKRIKWDAVVLDESFKVANPMAKITKKILQLGAPVKIALNGTVIANSIADVWSVAEWLEAGVLYGNWYRFRAIHAIMNPYIPGAITGWRNVAEIHKRTEHLIFKRTREEVLSHLPPLTEQIISFSLSPEEKREYERIRKESIVKIQGEDMPIANALVELMRLRQVTNGLFAFGSDVPSTKIRIMKELIETIPSDAKILIFSSFKTTADKVADELAALRITGDVPGAEREEIVARFSAEGGSRFLVMTAAGERGLNLQAASYTILMDNSWSNAGHEQRIGRNFRTGQTKPVYIYSLEASGTVDEKIRKILETKKGISDELMNWNRGDLDTLLQNGV